MRRIATFSFLAFSFSWSYWGWMLATGRVAGPGSTASHLPGLLGPAVAAILSAALFGGRGELVHLLRSSATISLRVGFALIAIAVPLLVALITLAVLPAPFPTAAAFAAFPGLPQGTGLMSAVVIVFIVNGIGEELGWRGALLPAFLERYGPIPATLATTAIWALWHLPLFWVNASMAALLGPALLGWLIGLLLGSFLLAYLWRITGGSVLATALWHTGYNFSVATEATTGVTAGVVSTLVMLWGAWVIWHWARQS